MRRVQLTEQSYRRLQDLAARTGEPPHAVLDRAIEACHRNRTLHDTNAAFAALRADPAAWREEQIEREAWEATLYDGLDDE